jgi:hypothetical protein
MVLPRTLPTGFPPRPPCGLDRHAGPFDPVDELRDTLGTDWYRCRACRSLVTRVNADPARVAA